MNDGIKWQSSFDPTTWSCWILPAWWPQREAGSVLATSGSVEWFVVMFIWWYRRIQNHSITGIPINAVASAVKLGVDLQMAYDENLIKEIHLIGLKNPLILHWSLPFLHAVFPRSFQSWLVLYFCGWIAWRKAINGIFGPRHSMLWQLSCIQLGSFFGEIQSLPLLLLCLYRWICTSSHSQCHFEELTACERCFFWWCCARGPVGSVVRSTCCCFPELGHFGVAEASLQTLCARHGP